MSPIIVKKLEYYYTLVKSNAQGEIRGKGKKNGTFLGKLGKNVKTHKMDCQFFAKVEGCFSQNAIAFEFGIWYSYV